MRWLCEEKQETFFYFPLTAIPFTNPDSWHRFDIANLANVVRTHKRRLELVWKTN